jgi:hypothetical protein
MSTGRFQEYKATFSNSYQRIKSNLSDLVQTKAALYVRGILDSTKAALGVDYMFDLSLTFVPSTKSAYSALKAIKYTVTGITFFVAGYRSYTHGCVDKNNHQKFAQLKDNLIHANKIFTSTEDLIKETNHLIKEAGYSLWCDDKALAQLKYETQTILPIKQDKSNCGKLMDSKSVLVSKAMIDGVISASSVYYIFNLFASLIGDTKSYEITEDFFIFTTLIISTLMAYHQRKLDKYAKKNLEIFKEDILPVKEKLEKIKKLLGSRGKLEREAKNCENQIGVPLQLGVGDQEKDIIESRYAGFFESNSVIGMRSVLNGAVKASGIDYILGIVFPHFFVARYVLSLGTLLFTTQRSYTQIHSNILFQNQLKELELEINEVNQLVTIAKKILMQQQEYLLPKAKMICSRKAEITIKEEDSEKDSNDDLFPAKCGDQVENNYCDNLLAADFSEMEDILSRIVSTEGLLVLQPSPSEIELGLVSHTQMTLLGKTGLFGKPYAATRVENSDRNPLLDSVRTVSYGGV